MQHLQFLFYISVLGTCFYFNYPVQIRQSALLISCLVLRPLKPFLRIETDENLLRYEIGGLVFQLYVMYSTLLLKLLMKILATILKNASEMWNFKFALTFQQCMYYSLHIITNLIVSIHANSKLILYFLFLYELYFEKGIDFINF